MATREETKRMIEVMQAYVDGEEIELRLRTHTTNWRSAATPCWTWDTCDYRVKEDMEQKACSIYRGFEDGARIHEDQRPRWRAVIDAVKRGEIT